MSIDTATLYALSALNLSLVAALVAIAAHSYPKELRRSGYLWSVATLAQGLGMLAILVRTILPEPVSVIAAHGLAIAGFAGFLHALYRFAGYRVRLSLIYAPVPLAVISAAFLFFVMPSYRWRVFLLSAIAAVQLALCSRVVWVARTSDAPMTSRFAAVGFAFASSLFVVRAVVSIAVETGATAMAVFRRSIPEQAVVLLLCLIILLLAFTFVMLCNERLNTALSRAAMIDPLTEHRNRRGIRELGEREVSRARRHDHELILALADLDHLKSINDKLGHAGGDAALRHVANSLAGALRTQDVFGRWGGDEFLIILTDTDVEGAREACNRACQAVSESAFSLGEQHHRCTLSIGMTSGRGPGLEFESMVQEADEALYVAKRLGRNRVAHKGDA